VDCRFAHHPHAGVAYGTFTRGGQIDAHTPSWMLAGVGWILMLLMAAVLFLPKHAVSR
jgi:hypothetical protein